MIYLIINSRSKETCIVVCSQDKLFENLERIGWNYRKCRIGVEPDLETAWNAKLIHDGMALAGMEYGHDLDGKVITIESGLIETFEEHVK